jgi:CRP/FNR family transcriptional regulator, cyclic AMP receptor protein
VDALELKLATLTRSYLFEELPRDELEPLARVASLRHLRRNDPVCQVGDPADEIYIVVSGEVKDSVVNLDGDEVVHFVHGPAMTVGEPGFFAVDRNRILQIIATGPTTLLELHRRHLEPFLREHPDVMFRVAERLASNTRWQTTQISSLLTRPLIDRLVLRLIELAETNPEPSQVISTPKISQTLLAAMVGVSRENVNRALSKLASNGSIRRVNGRYELTDEAALRSIATRDWKPVVFRDKHTGL